MDPNRRTTRNAARLAAQQQRINPPSHTGSATSESLHGASPPPPFTPAPAPAGNVTTTANSSTSVQMPGSFAPPSYVNTVGASMTNPASAATASNLNPASQSLRHSVERSEPPASPNPFLTTTVPRVDSRGGIAPLSPFPAQLSANRQFFHNTGTATPRITVPVTNRIREIILEESPGISNESLQNENSEGERSTRGFGRNVSVAGVGVSASSVGRNAGEQPTTRSVPGQSSNSSVGQESSEEGLEYVDSGSEQLGTLNESRGQQGEEARATVHVVSAPANAPLVQDPMRPGHFSAAAAHLHEIAGPLTDIMRDGMTQRSTITRDTKWPYR
ncbi:hypothetical protein CVT24_009919 [Panaeolus cyanescens]|uniref:Uncharacterized protein n=1 Tax=Panaeolus cyanescens TaxID=181874 RepID=A0A409WW43_9AGAR|nr:hypothetical protein CVT24_009919 [Panaeolus cyanescens]